MLSSFKNRLETFKSCKVLLDFKVFAEDGFVYCEKSDSVCCLFCNIVIHRWHQLDTLFDYHLPKCSYAANHRFNPNQIKKTMQLRDSPIEEARVPYVLGPTCPNFMSLEVRLKSFKLWQSADAPTPLELAKAGFYYCGIDDRTRCFYCNSGIRKWKLQMDAWEEHAIVSPNCGFLLLKKSKSYVDEVCRNFSKCGVDNSEIKFKNVNENQLPSFQSVGITEAEEEEEDNDNTTDDRDRNDKDDCEITSIIAKTSNIDLDGDSGGSSISSNDSRSNITSAQCKICLVEDLSIVFLPCSHMISCDNCSNSLVICAVCRIKIEDKFKVYI